MWISFNFVHLLANENSTTVDEVLLITLLVQAVRRPGVEDFDIAGDLHLRWTHSLDLAARVVSP